MVLSAGPQRPMQPKAPLRENYSFKYQKTTLNTWGETFKSLFSRWHFFTILMNQKFHRQMVLHLHYSQTRWLDQPELILPQAY